MEPFTVFCPTCQSRIRVRNAALIGQLVNCPKCQSIVLIADPDKASTPPASQQPVDSKAMTAEGIEAGGFSLNFDDPPQDGEYRLLPPEVSPTAPLRTGTSAGSTLDAGSSASGSHAIPPVPSSTIGRASPDQGWTSESTSRKRQLLLVMVVGLSSLAITGILFVLFLRSTSSSGDSEDQIAKATEPPAIKGAGKLEEKQSADDVDLAPSGESLKETDAEPACDASSQLPGEETQENPPADSGDPVSSAATTTPADPTLPPPSGDQTERSIASGDPGQKPPEDLSDDSKVTQSDVAPKLDNDNAEVIVPSKLKELAELIGQPFEISAPQAVVVPERAPVTAEELGLGNVKVDKALPTVDLHAASNERRIRALKLDDVPLAHAINYLSLASGLPMVLDAYSLSAANRNPSDKIRFVLGDGSVAEGAHKLAQQLGLQLQSIENRYYRFSAPPPDAQLLPLGTRIDDLIVDEAGQQWLRSFLDLFFPQAASGFTIQSGMLVTDPQAVDPMTRFSVFAALEAWRVQSGLPPAMSQYDSTNLVAPFVTVGDMKRLAQPIQQITDSPRPLASWLSSLGSELGIKCWIDWPSLAALGLEPGSLVTIVTHQRSLESVLQELAFEYNLVTAIVDQESLWITDQESYRQAARVFVIPSQDRPLDYWEQYFRPLTPVVSGGVSRAELILSPDKRTIVVRSCLPNLQFN